MTKPRRNRKPSATQPTEVHPRQRLSFGAGQRNELLRSQVKEMLERVVDGCHLSFATIADLLQVSRQRISQLAKEMGIQGRIKQQVRGSSGRLRWMRQGRLRGRRRSFAGKEGERQDV